MGLVSCLHPHVIRNKYTGELVSVPCGKCNICLNRARALWVSRLREESTCHTYTMFLTLTYDDAHLPKVDLSTLSPESFSDTFEQSYNDSLDFISYHNNCIPVVSIKDIQNFFKRLRSKIVYNHGKNKNIRYFCCSEYGPTTFRPHYHLLLWFDAPELVSTIKKYIYESWKSYNPHKTISSFFKRNKCVFVYGKAEQYVAGYVNMYSHLPAVLREKLFRPWHCQSSNPPIGSIRVFKRFMEELQFGNVDKVTLHRCSSSQQVVLPLWRGLENRFFPRCQGFSMLSSRDRVALYKLGSLFGKEYADDFNSFEKRLLSEWYSFSPIMFLLRKVFTFDSKNDYKRWRESIKRAFAISRRVRELRSVFELSVEEYVSRIETYYSRKNYLALVNQLEFEFSLANSNDSSLIKFYPDLVDQQFYANLRNIDTCVFCNLIDSFGLSYASSHLFSKENSQEYKSVKALADKIAFDNHKTKIKKDYLANHPDSYLNQYCLTLSKIKTL